MIIVSTQSFYIKSKDSKFVVGQYNVVDSESQATSLIEATRELHSRLFMGMYDPSKIGSFKAALETSDMIIKSEIGGAINYYLSQNKINLSVTL